jgi:hypothetical protein
MRYLLVGNGPSKDVEAKAKHAEAIVQINSCMHAARIPFGKTTHVFLVNTGINACPPTVKELMGKKELLPSITVVRSRNEVFYYLKGKLIGLRSQWHARDYIVNDAWRNLPWPTEEVSFKSTMKLEYKLLKAGMPVGWVPSTGMIAYHWLRQKLTSGDSLDITGFTFEGVFERHPWEIEKTLIKGIYPPGYRDDPSYEKE